MAEVLARGPTSTKVIDPPPTFLDKSDDDYFQEAWSFSVECACGHVSTRPILLTNNYTGEHFRVCSWRCMAVH